MNYDSAVSMISNIDGNVAVRGEHGFYYGADFVDEEVIFKVFETIWKAHKIPDKICTDEDGNMSVEYLWVNSRHGKLYKTHLDIVFGNDTISAYFDDESTENHYIQFFYNDSFKVLSKYIDMLGRDNMSLIREFTSCKRKYE